MRINVPTKTIEDTGWVLRVDVDEMTIATEDGWLLAARMYQEDGLLWVEVVGKDRTVVVTSNPAGEVWVT